jgi:hypothetical protein
MASRRGTVAAVSAAASGYAAGIMIPARLSHLDNSVCIDHWSCGEQEHTIVPPRCGAVPADRQPGCELPKGHPGPHLTRKCER